MSETFWNGEPARCEKVRVVVADYGTFPRYWAKAEGIVGQEIEAVRVDYFDDPFYSRGRSRR